MKQLFILVISMQLLSCSKSNDNNTDAGTVKTHGFWKGNTSPLQTSSSYAVGVVLKQNGAARAFRFYAAVYFLPTQVSLLF